MSETLPVVGTGFFLMLLHLGSRKELWGGELLRGRASKGTAVWGLLPGTKVAVCFVL